MKELAAKNRDKLIDMLTERLTFERAGVRLYDAIVRNMERSGAAQIARMIPTMKAHGAQEKEHVEWLESQIRDLGGDVYGKTELADLIQAESVGFEKVVRNDGTLSHQLHALLSAELVDNSDWEVLLELADDADDADARREITKRLHEEKEHLLFVRRAVVAFARRNVLGEALTMPSP